MDSWREPLTPALSRKNGEREKSYAPAAFFAITLR
ncbi:hypothetical protein AB7M16_001860 [Bradyrhizobium sp. USDA 372]